MLRKVIFFTILSLFFAACSSDPDGYFQRSANNRLFDRSSGKSSKRPPLYNKKYVSKAKKNIMSGDYDDDDEDEDEDDEVENISQRNIEMYKKMIEQDMNRGYKDGSIKRKRRSSRQAYPSMVDANRRMRDIDDTSNLELKEEMEQIKAMLSEAKNDLASYKCPTAQSIEKEQSNKQSYKKNKNSFDLDVQEKQYSPVKVSDPAVKPVSGNRVRKIKSI